MSRAPRKKKALADTVIRKAKPGTEPYKLVDGEGLYLYVTPAGGKGWRFDYRFLGKRQTLVIGPLESYSLADARDAHGEARKALGRGVNPAAIKKHEKAVEKHAAKNTFAAWAKQWYDGLSPKRSEGWRIVVDGW